jgi:hypothetical protein
MAAGDATVLRMFTVAVILERRGNEPSTNLVVDHVTNIEIPREDEEKLYRGPANRSMALVRLTQSCNLVLVLYLTRLIIALPY